MLQEMPRDLPVGRNVDTTRGMCTAHAEFEHFFIEVISGQGKQLDAIKQVSEKITLIETEQGKMQEQIRKIKKTNKEQQNEIRASSQFINNIKANWPTILTIVTALVAFKLKGG